MIVDPPIAGCCDDSVRVRAFMLRVLGFLFQENKHSTAAMTSGRSCASFFLIDGAGRLDFC